VAAGPADRRFPRGVHRVGQEPDPRFSLANERTFLAWIRTALAFLALGAALHALPVLIPPTVRFVAALVLICVGLVIPVTAWLGWARAERALRTGAPLPASAVAPVVVAGIALAAVQVLVGVVLA
jgi:inner membrane protein YidH